MPRPEPCAVRRDRTGRTPPPRNRRGCGGSAHRGCLARRGAKTWPSHADRRQSARKGGTYQRSSPTAFRHGGRLARSGGIELGVASVETGSVNLIRLTRCRKDRCACARQRMTARPRIADLSLDKRSRRAPDDRTGYGRFDSLLDHRLSMPAWGSAYGHTRYGLSSYAERRLFPCPSQREMSSALVVRALTNAECERDTVRHEGVVDRRS